MEPNSNDAMPRVAFINRSYWPDMEATGQLLEDLCTFMAKRWDVTVVVGQPNRNDSQHDYQRSGMQIRDGVTINRLAHTTFPKRFKIGRLTNLVSFTRQVQRWGREKEQSLRPFDMLICETDPFFLPIVTANISARAGTKFVAYVQDVYPDIAVALGVVKEGYITREIRRRLKKAYEQADRIIVLDDDMLNRIASWGIPRHKFSIVPNWVDTQLIRPLKFSNQFRLDNGINDQFVVMHSGNMGMSQQLETLIDATIHPDWPKHAVLALVGDGAKRGDLVEHARNKQATKVLFFDYQPRANLATSLSAADLQVVSMAENLKGCLAPSKLYGILASRTAVMAIVPNDSALAKSVDQHEIGVVVDPGDVPSIARCVNRFANDSDATQQTGIRARQLGESTFDRQICCEQFERTALAILRDG